MYPNCNRQEMKAQWTAGQGRAGRRIRTKNVPAARAGPFKITSCCVFGALAWKGGYARRILRATRKAISAREPKPRPMRSGVLASPVLGEVSESPELPEEPEPVSAM